jgi:glycyl-tRNA synthetase beta chain
MTNNNRKNALLEICIEEMPSSYIEPALKQIKDIVLKIFYRLGLKYSALKVYGTPRRLVLIIENLSDKSDDRIDEVLGPSLRTAKDAYGKYTHAAIGFALKNDVIPEELIVKTTKRGTYLSIIKKTSGEKTKKLLSVIFMQVIKNISFPKVMLWEESGFKFARPIRSIAALYGKDVVKFKIANVNSSNWTIGLSAYSSDKIRIDLPENYLMIMRNKSVIVNQEERHEELRRSIESVARSVGSVIFDEDLANEVNYLIEYPSAILCIFDKKYLSLPVEVLTICMKKNQKCFAVNDKFGDFSNYFVGIKNGVPMYQEIVKEGYEKVVAARLADAEFFYHNDLKNTLNVNIEKLKDVVFHDKLGTIYEKINRIKRIALFFNEKFDMRIDVSELKRAIMFSKVDLVSKIVFEYPELQGIIGKIYALKFGESSNVAAAIEQHYWPLSASGQLPVNKIASLISLADRIDTLAANFSIGFVPSGSADPYGLRRVSIGFIRIAMKILPNHDLGYAIKKVFEFLPENIRNSPEANDAYERLLDFFWHRIENILEVEGYDSYEIKAITNASNNGIKDLGFLYQKLNALRDARKKDDFSCIMSVFKRINNIINQKENQNINILKTINEDLFIEDAERVFYTVAKKVKIEVEEFMLGNEYNKIFCKVLEIKPSIDGFFKKVMVMSENKLIKLNRIALLYYVKNIFAEFVDFSALKQ